MPITVQDLDDLDPTLVTQFDAALTAIVQEDNPTFELRAGVLHDMLIHVKAQLDAATQTNINLVRQSNSLQAIEENPDLADTEVVDQMLSNYNIVRNPGEQASGPVTFVLDTMIGVVIPNTMVLTINGLEFNPDITYAARTSSLSIITDSDTLIYQIGPSLWAFDINVTAVELGSAGNAARAVTATPDVEPPHFVKAYVKSDFTGGVDADTNQTLIDKLESGLAVKAWSNRPSILGLLREQTDFADILYISSIGFGDPEMARDQHAVWPGHMGGRSDLYLQSQPLYQNLTVLKTATLISKVGPLGTWQAGLAIDEAPGFYQVDRVLLPDVDQSTPGFPASSDVRSIDLISPPSDTLLPPDIITVPEGTYSRYQAVVIRWADTITDATPLAIGATNDYNVVVRIMPLIAEIQDFLNGREQRPPMCDVLVRGAVPCFTTVAFTVNYKKNTPAPSISEIQTAVANAVNNMGFTGELPRSFIDQVLHEMLNNLVSVVNYTLSGTIRQPDGINVFITDPQKLVIPSDPVNTVTGRTTIFFLKPDDITVTLVAVDVPVV
jgi:hypothetical protein